MTTAMISFSVSRAQLKMFSAVCANFVVLWFTALIATKDLIVLIRDLILAILFWQLGIKAAELLEEV